MELPNGRLGSHHHHHHHHSHTPTPHMPAHPPAHHYPGHLPDFLRYHQPPPPMLYRTVEKMWSGGASGGGGGGGGGGGLPGGLAGHLGVSGEGQPPHSLSSHESHDVKKATPTPPPTAAVVAAAAAAVSAAQSSPAAPTPMDTTSHLPAMLSHLTQGLSNHHNNPHRDSPTPTQQQAPPSQPPPPPAHSPTPIHTPTQDVQKMVSTRVVVCFAKLGFPCVMMPLSRTRRASRGTPESPAQCLLGF
ncbi:one cut domain family member 2-like [Penaeus japonicus]|uniref:one cut domain family member 2-like n=1 Tax=Penaeus japonicus TaxID=27405 RepID=UPI001C70E93C|nr:one cut domain family member 2-like [Penaeus japonicus]